jgi:hypothetical protein
LYATRTATHMTVSTSPPCLIGVWLAVCTSAKAAKLKKSKLSEPIRLFS